MPSKIFIDNLNEKRPAFAHFLYPIMDYISNKSSFVIYVTE